ncbi:MAG: hypothetical protein KatS3mg003_0356 [Candidatus Nitrosocaldaceae archaeon]|nr:MAG: hypothetical protein KatS3mg003_0356 [Candidatus Nitrosocaldaceae archaeon]
MDLGVAFLGILLIMIGMFLVTISLKRRGNATGIIMIGPIPIIVSGNKPYLFVIPIILIVIIILLMLR